MLLIALAASATGAAAHAALAASVGCSQVLTESVALDGDMACSGDGLVIAADGITVDLNGHALRGDGTGGGVRIAGSSGVTVTNGTISGFAVGVGVSGNDNLLASLQIHGNIVSGVRLASGGYALRTRVIGNQITGNGEGLRLSAGGSAQTELRGNSISQNVGVGVDLGS